MKKLIITLVSITVLFLIIEVFFRLFYPISQYSITHAPWGFRHLPNTTVTFYGEKAHWGWRQRGVEIRYNDKGLRCYRCPYGNWTGLLFRIMCLGDSWVEDMGSSQENLFTSHMDTMLPPTHYVINAGHYAFDNAQELMWYEMEGVKYKPDIVFLFYTGDEASLEYAHISPTGLVLTPKVFTRTQIAYRAVVSLIRRNTHFGSWVLNRLNRLKPVDKALIIAGPDTPPVMAGEFRPIDAMIYKRLNEAVNNAKGTLVMVHCYKDWSEGKVSFFRENNIRYLNLDYDVIKKCRRQKAIDIAEGNYDPMKESHRFGYKAPEAVSIMLIDYLKEEGLI